MGHGGAQGAPHPTAIERSTQEPRGYRKERWSLLAFHRLGGDRLRCLPGGLALDAPVQLAHDGILGRIQPRGQQVIPPFNKPPQLLLISAPSTMSTMSAVGVASARLEAAGTLYI